MKIVSILKGSVPLVHSGIYMPATQFRRLFSLKVDKNRTKMAKKKESVYRPCSSKEGRIVDTGYATSWG